jgi:hypothetical protein
MGDQVGGVEALKAAGCTKIFYSEKALGKNTCDRREFRKMLGDFFDSRPLTPEEIKAAGLV